MQPDDVGVLIPRGATLLEVSRTAEPLEAKSFLATAVADYEKVLALQASYFARLSVHARGELLFGLADGAHRLGDTEKARRYFTELLAAGKGSAYESRAAAWLAGGQQDRPSSTTCLGCHKQGVR
jgi:hypothetical protein